ncbi:MAG: muts domain V-domain-containing protein [Benjaminiella poitrasii]|nr:MAG: muts domain V-domain-containing protein [Benjaminiella poitrasii]
MASFMCIQWKSKKLGCSYFSGTSLELYLMEDERESDQFEYTTMLIAQVSPTLIIVPDSENSSLQEFISSEYGNSIEVKKVISKDFTFDKGRYQLLNWYLQLEQVEDGECVYMRDPEEGNKTQAYLRLEGIIHMDESQLSASIEDVEEKKEVGCAGVLLKHLQEIDREEGVVISEQERPSSHQPITLKAFSSDKCMHINSDTIKSLCIFDLETHPNMHQSKEKERLSLFGLLDKTKSVLGKQLLKEWLSRPTRDPRIIASRHAAIRLFSKPELRDKTLELSNSLLHIKNINQLLSRLRESKATINDWQYILKFAYYSICIFSILNQLSLHDHSLLILQNAKKEIVSLEAMKEIGSYIDSIINFESSKKEGQLVVKEGINEELDALRDKYDKLDDYLLQVSQEVGSTLPVGLSAALNVVYFPQLGYLITLPQYHLQRRSKIVDSEASTSNFTTADNLYYKNDKTKELDENLGDIHAMIADKEIEIIQGLSEHVLIYTIEFTKIVQLLSELDCLISLTMTALKFNYVQPVITNDDSLTIIEGRHPLQELCVDIFIPNDTHLKGGQGFLSGRGDHQAHLSSLYGNQTSSSSSSRLEEEKSLINSIQVVTGANFSGKSVYLKQVALIVYMAHIGSFVPAASARIGIVDKLFTRIQTSETVSKPQSAFGFDLQQLNRALNNSTQHSLVIIDEFGKGTDAVDGAALFCSVLGYFLSQQEKCPKVIASTHFHELMSKSFLSSEDGITLSETEIINDRKEDGDEVAFLYRIIPRVQEHNESYGIWCATIAGLPAHTLERAVQLGKKYRNAERIERIEIEQDKLVYQQLERIRNEFLETEVNEMNPYELISLIESLI